jgi:P4 family phage/plasmid primase-like protien
MAAEATAPVSAEIRAHVEMLHQLAHPLSGSGQLVVASYGEDPDGTNPRTGKTGAPISAAVEHFRIGDVDGMVAAVVRLGRDRYRNVYIPLAVLRSDLSRGKKGQEEDVIGVLGFVIDDDPDRDKGATELLLPANYVLQTSVTPQANRQHFYLLDEILGGEAAKPIAAALTEFHGTDHGSKDLSHVWRVPGCLNWPNAKKVHRFGRPREPQLVTVLQPWDGSLTAVGDLRAALDAHALSDRAGSMGRDRRLDTDPTTQTHNARSPHPDRPEVPPELTDRFAALPGWLRHKIIRGRPEGERSRALFDVIANLHREGWTRQEIQTVIAAHPNGIGAKYADRGDLDREIDRVLQRCTPASDAPVDWPDHWRDGAEGGGGDGDDGPAPVGFTEDALADAFADRHQEGWRYVAPWGQWLTWSGAVWRRENTLQAFDLARRICREAAVCAETAKIRTKLSTAATVAAVERLARSDRRHASTTEIWDGDPWSINTPAGIVDLRSGASGRHDPQRYMTKLAGAAPGGDCPIWMAFLETLSGGDRDLQAYLQRMAGYCLTGVTTEHALFFFYGTGANGKSVFANTLTAIMGDYATAAAMDMFMATHGDRHPTDMAGLRGARMVTSIETEQGSRWAESKLKALTGGDRITARFMRQDFFEFTPQFKLLVVGNHKPSIRNVDEAMRRRLHMVPFTVTIPPAKRDKSLSDRLLAERDGFFAWALAGCLEWQRTGLRPPAAVMAATEDYFEAEDAVGRWIEERCTVGPSRSATSAMLYGDWKAWAEANGEYAGSQKRFSESLTTRGYERRNTNSARGFRGIGLRDCNSDLHPGG